MPAPRLLAALLLPLTGLAADWSLARNSHFEVYSQEGEAQARAALQWFEQLRAIVRQETALDITGRIPVRVLGFRSETEYSRYRVTPAADAYFVNSGDRNYIVMSSLSAGAFTMAAHEYAHLIQHAAATRFPPWLSEGLADLFSTLRIDHRGASLGGDLPGRLADLRRNRWMPLETLMALPADSPVRDVRSSSALFYAQSWALAGMLSLSPQYRPGFARFAALLAAGGTGPAALQSAYGKTVAAVTRDLSAWVTHGVSKTILLPAPQLDPAPVSVAQVPANGVQLIMAELLLIAGDLDGAESAYRDIARDTGDTADTWAGLGAVAASRKQFDRAREFWKRAIDAGLNDASICYRYAELLDGDPARREERRAALERAVALQPAFDDARWVLALLEANAGRPASALAHLEAMQEIPLSRAYHYWCAVADALTSLGRNDEAQAAATRASEKAATPDERAHAHNLSYIAQTHLAVRLSRDAAGNPKMVATRVPNDTVNFNPFIEPADDLRLVRGTLRAVECGATGLRITLDTGADPLSLLIPDPTRVQMRNAPETFVCGPQPANSVLVEYAARKNQEGVVRGIEFQ